MQLHCLLVVVLVSDVADVKVMSSTVAVISAVTRVVNNYNIRTEPKKVIQTESEFLQKKPNRILKNLFRTSLLLAGGVRVGALSPQRRSIAALKAKI